MSIPNDKWEVVNKFSDWINQRPGIDSRNYGSYNSLKQEYRRIAKQKRDASAALNLFCSLPYDVSLMTNAMRYFSGRLSFDDIGDLQYCTGQYWPTEYRLVADVVLSGYVFEITRVNRKACFAVFRYHNKNIKRMIRIAFDLARFLSETGQDYQKRNKRLDKIERDYKQNLGLYHAIVGLAYQYKKILYK